MLRAIPSRPHRPGRIVGNLATTESCTASSSQAASLISRRVSCPGGAQALRANLTAYDAAYVAAAEAMDVPLATLDLKLVNAPGPTCEFIYPVEALFT